MCVPIPSSQAGVPLITLVTAKEPAPPPASTTKAIFSLATGMTHFLHHYKATSLACSQMVSSVGIWLAPRSLLFTQPLICWESCLHQNNWLGYLSTAITVLWCVQRGTDGICAVVMYDMHISMSSSVSVESEWGLTLLWHILMKTVAKSHYASTSINMFRDHSQIRYVLDIAIHTHLSLTVSWQSLWQLYRVLHYSEAMLLNHSLSIKICAYAYILKYTSYMWCSTVKAV